MNIIGQVGIWGAGVLLGLTLGVLGVELLPEPDVRAPGPGMVQAAAAGRSWVVATEDGTTRAYGGASWVLPPSERDALVRLLLPSPDGRRILVADARVVRIVSVESGILEATLVIPQSEGLSELSTAAWSSDGRVAIGTVDGNLGVWLPSAERADWIARMVAPIDEIAWVDGDRMLLVTSRGERSAWDARTGAHSPSRSGDGPLKGSPCPTSPRSSHSRSY